MATASMSDFDVKPSPGTFNAPRQYGPIKIPATRYAVTAGNCKSFAKRDKSKPESNAMDKDTKICIKKASVLGRDRERIEIVFDD